MSLKLPRVSILLLDWASYQYLFFCIYCVNDYNCRYSGAVAGAVAASAPILAFPGMATPWDTNSCVDPLLCHC